MWFLLCGVFVFLHSRDYELRPRERPSAAPPAIRRARAARPRESVPRALLGRPPRVLGSRPRAPWRLSRDRPPERLRPTRLRSRRGSDKARPWRRPPCRRSWCVSTPRTRPRLSCSPPTGLEGPRAPAPRRSTSARPRRRTRLERSWSLGTSWRAESGASFFCDERGIRVETHGRASRRASVFRHASRRDRDPLSIRHTRRDTRGHRLTPTTSVAPPPTRDAREKKITQRFFSATWAPASRAWCFAS